MRGSGPPLLGPFRAHFGPFWGYKGPYNANELYIGLIRALNGGSIEPYSQANALSSYSIELGTLYNERSRDHAITSRAHASSLSRELTAVNSLSFKMHLHFI